MLASVRPRQVLVNTKSGKLPSDIPAGANRTYAKKGWLDWGRVASDGHRECGASGDPSGVYRQVRTRKGWVVPSPHAQM